jgi:hypothetical protein
MYSCEVYSWNTTPTSLSTYSYLTGTLRQTDAVSACSAKYSSDYLTTSGQKYPAASYFSGKPVTYGYNLASSTSYTTMATYLPYYQRETGSDNATVTLTDYTPIASSIYGSVYTWSSYDYNAATYKPATSLDCYYSFSLTPTATRTVVVAKSSLDIVTYCSKPSNTWYSSYQSYPTSSSTYNGGNGGYNSMATPVTGNYGCYVYGQTPKISATVSTSWYTYAYTSNTNQPAASVCKSRISQNSSTPTTTTYSASVQTYSTYWEYVSYFSTSTAFPGGYAVITPPPYTANNTKITVTDYVATATPYLNASWDGNWADCYFTAAVTPVATRTVTMNLTMAYGTACYFDGYSYSTGYNSYSSSYSSYYSSYTPTSMYCDVQQQYHFFF